MNRHQCTIVSLVLVLLACGIPESKLPTLAKPELFKPEQREAIAAAAEAMKRLGERPETFRVDVKQEEPGILAIHLWHESAFTLANRDVSGNPGGKCRTIRYDLTNHQIISNLLWKQAG